MSALLVIVGIAGMFLLLIAPHEAGHFALAKLFKVRVIEFSIGAGTRLWSTTRGGTLYAIRAIPIMGYVRMGGMEGGDFDDPDGFHRKVKTEPGKIAAVLPNTPAAAAGFQVGDRLTSVDGRRIAKPDQLKRAEDAAPGVPLVVSGIHPNGRSFTVTVTPQCDAAGKSCQMGLRVLPVMTVQDAVGQGVQFPYIAIRNIVQGLGQLVTGQIPGGLLGPNGVTGPIGIADVTAQSVSRGLDTYVFFVALLSVALGFTNLLPFLTLDGGRVAVVLIEVLRRRPFDRNSELNFQRIGLVALIAIAVLISALDIQRIASGQFPGLQR